MEGPENPEDKARLVTHDVLTFVRKLSGTNARRRVAQLSNYISVRDKRRRAASTRRRQKQRSDGAICGEKNGKQLTDSQMKLRDASKENTGDMPASGRMRARSRSRESWASPCDRCGRRKKRRCGRRRRRSKCRRKRRRRSRCRRRRRSRRRRRRSRCRRRRRSRCRRRRRRSCARRRRCGRRRR